MTSEPSPDTRISTRQKTASRKQRQLSKSSFSLSQRLRITTLWYLDEQTEAGVQTELEWLRQQLARQKQKNQKLTERLQGNTSLCDPEIS